DVDDTTPARLGHAAQYGLGQTVNTVQVGVDDIQPLVVFHAHHQVIAGDAGIIDENQRLTEVLLYMRQGRGNRLIVTHIKHQAGTFDTVVLESFGNTLGTGIRRRGTNHHGTL